MIRTPNDPNKNIAIVGFSNVKIQNITKFLEQFRKENKEAPIQFFDAKKVAGLEGIASGELTVTLLAGVNGGQETVELKSKGKGPKHGHGHGKHIELEYKAKPKTKCCSKR